MNIITIPSLASTHRYELFFDAKACHLRKLVQYQQTQRSGASERAVWINEFDDFRPVDGLILPHVIKTKADPEWWVRMIVANVKYSINVDYDPSVFSTDLRPELGGWRKPQPSK